jgi:hypothetical protein
VTFGEEENARVPPVDAAMSGGTRATLTLYRHVLKAAARFPSKNRTGIVEEIKTEFRVARGETDGEVLKKKLALATGPAEGVLRPGPGEREVGGLAEGTLRRGVTEKTDG